MMMMSSIINWWGWTCLWSSDELSWKGPVISHINKDTEDWQFKLDFLFYTGPRHTRNEQNTSRQADQILARFPAGSTGAQRFAWNVLVVWSMFACDFAEQFPKFSSVCAML